MTIYPVAPIEMRNVQPSGDIENGLPTAAAAGDNAPPAVEDARPGLCQRLWRAAHSIPCAIASGTLGVGGAVAICVYYPPARPLVAGLGGLSLLVGGGVLAMRDAEAGRGRVAPEEPVRNAAVGV